MKGYGSLVNDEEARASILNSPRIEERKEITGSIYSRRILSVVLSVFLMAFGTILVAVQKNGHSPIANFFLYPTTGYKTSFDSLTVRVTNEYGDYMTNLFPYPFLKESILVEPYRGTTFTIANTNVGCTYDWLLIGDDYEYSGSTTGPTFGVTVEAGASQAALTISETGCSSSRSLEIDVWVKYIRRDISSLTDSDREDFLDALHTLYTVSTLEGKKKYGSGYRSINFLAVMHNDAVNTPVCDELHGDVGFLPNHIAMYLMVEQSMQLINPKTALHHVDVSKMFSSNEFQENHMVDQLDGGSWNEIFSDKWFGRNDPRTGRIIDSRWENLTVPRLTPELMHSEGVNMDETFWPDDADTQLSYDAPVHFKSPYGYVRPTYLYTPYEHLTRYQNVMMIEDVTSFDDKDMFTGNYAGVTCDTYTELLSSTKGGSLGLYLYLGGLTPHGPVHYTIGGRSGDSALAISEIFQEELGMTDEEVFKLSTAMETFALVYFDWTDDRFTSMGVSAPYNCSADPWQEGELLMTGVPGMEGGPSCTFTDTYMSTDDGLNSLIEAIFGESSNMTAKLESLDFDKKQEMVGMLANYFPYTSDLIASSSPMDPMFWVMHQHIEVLMQYSDFKGWFDSYEVTRHTTGQCAGHEPTNTISWFLDYKFPNSSVNSAELPMMELIGASIPTGNKYETLMPYVYGTNTFSACNTTEWDFL